MDRRPDRRVENGPNPLPRRRAGFRLPLALCGLPPQLLVLAAERRRTPFELRALVQDSLPQRVGVPPRSGAMSVTTRRVRGALLRLVMHRATAVVAGAVLLVPAVALMVGGFTFENWVTDGLTLIAGGTGAALLLTGVVGRRPDWVDPDEPLDSD